MDNRCESKHVFLSRSECAESDSMIAEQSSVHGFGAGVAVRQQDCNRCAYSGYSN